VQDILMSIGAESDSALAIGTELGEWNLQLTARRPQNDADYATYSAEARGYTQQQALDTYFFNEDACAPSPCQNGAGCVDLAAANQYQCLCPAGFTGNECQTETLTAAAAFTGYAFGPYGPYQGCEVFIDLNGNRIWDAGEPKETTDVLGDDTEGRFTFHNLDTRVAPLMRIIMIPSLEESSGPGQVSAVVSPHGNECPYLETVVPGEISTSSEWTTVAQQLGSTANPIAMSDITTLQLYRATRNPPGNPVATQGIGSAYSNNGGWQTEVLAALNLNAALKPFELRCNYMRGQGPQYMGDACQQGPQGNAVFSALLALHTLFRVGLAQKMASLRVINAQSFMLAKLAQILPAWTDSAASVLASPVDSIAVYNEIWQDVEYPVSVVVEGMVAVPGYGSVQTQQTMVYRCETAVAAERLVGTDGMLTGADAPALGDWTLAGATGYLFSDLSPVAQAFVQSRNLLEGNAAQCCSARNCYDNAFEEQCFLTNDALPQAVCDTDSTLGCVFEPGHTARRDGC